LDNNFHHLVGQKTSSALEIYVDGLQRASVPASGAISYTLGANLMIGRHANGVTTRYFNGTIDEVGVYNRALSASEISALAGAGVPAPAPGGFVEQQATATRARWSNSFIQSVVPSARGPFTFPAPYLTRGVRITDASDCGGTDCVWDVGYSYWRNTNAHAGSNDMLIFLGLNTGEGGSGPTLFRYNKTTDAITKVGPLFPAGSKFLNSTGSTWYFSATQPNTLYVNDGPRLLRYDVVSKVFTTVFDITVQFDDIADNPNIWQTHSSNDDLVHSATLTNGFGQSAPRLGCLVFNETTSQYRYYPKVASGNFDECHLDKSGRWTLSQEIITTPGDFNMRIFDNQTGIETRIEGPNGTLGHMDMGYGYAIGADGYHSLPNATILWDFEPTIVQGPVLHRNINWNVGALNHISHTNAKPNVPAAQQHACGSTADTNYSVQNEITCVRMDGSNDQLIVAPIMTDLNASGGGSGTYGKYPKGNLDVTGKYFIWTTNLGGNRLDAFLVKVPDHLLITP
jgi:hypothetical protein